jgi:hypothetical protein
VVSLFSPMLIARFRKQGLGGNDEL